MPNRLASEKSPYLLQHAGNPVDWYPWGEDAFAEARRAGKPIFLSVGYSTCHWCHVMERESFESEEIAAILNREFVPIKVDREERPDVDRVYMTFVQATTGSGGWPMSVWLTPDLQPFYGGTYFPPDSRWGRPGFVEILRELARLWQSERGRVLQAASELTAQLRAIGRTASSAGVPPREALDRAAADLERAFDPEHGGFGAAPKFPRPSELLFLFRAGGSVARAEARHAALETLRAMARGGIYDHVGGGFHRYSVDSAWRVPHFEKMLYDQAQLVLAYLEAFQATGAPEFRRVAAETLAYVQRDLADPAGGFYSAEDADSQPPGAPAGARKAEGAFYVWTEREVAELLGHDTEAFALRFGVRPDGNAPADPQGEFRGQNILYAARPIDEVAELTGRTAADVTAAMARSLEVLRDRRGLRPRPHLDDKVLTSWNGLMIAACARAARVLGDPASLASAERAARFVRDRMWNGATRRLLRRFRGGDAAIDAFAEDYAFLIFGLIELFQADHDPAWLEWAITLQATQDARFRDPIDGGWFSTSGEDPSVLLRVKEEYDGAEPAASSIGAWNALMLDHLTGQPAHREAAEAALRLFGPRLAGAPRAVPMMLAVLSMYWTGIEQVVIIGGRESGDTRALLDAVNRAYLPFTVTIVAEPGTHQARLSKIIPALGGMHVLNAQATAYVYRDFACQAPTTDVDELTRLLGAPIREGESRSPSSGA
jgi:hypothetical protein